MKLQISTREKRFLSSRKQFILLQLKITNQFCIEFFTTSKRAYQAASLSKELPTAHAVKARDSYQQCTLHDGKVARRQKRICSFQGADKTDDKSFHRFHVIATSEFLAHLAMWNYLWLQRRWHHHTALQTVSAFDISDPESAWQMWNDWKCVQRHCSALGVCLLGSVCVSTYFLGSLCAKCFIVFIS